MCEIVYILTYTRS